MHDVYQKQLQKKRRETWIKLIASWRLSGVTARKFCDQEQVKYADLKRWYYRLGKKDKAKFESEQAKPPLQFIPVSVSSAPMPQNNQHLDLIMNNDYRLRIYPNFSEPLLLQLLTTLRKINGC